MTEVELLREENKLLKLQIVILTKKIEELDAKLGMNSTNSSMPPSSDMFKKKDKKTKSLRQKSDKSSGGQIGHIGSTLKKVESPDEVIDIPHTHCEHCDKDITTVDTDAIKTRQVFDIPEIKITATEYRIHSKTCPYCKKNTKSKFPKDITHEAQYGKNIKATIINFNVYQAIPYKRIKELLFQIFKLNLSEGTISNTLKKAYLSLKPVEDKIKEAIIASDIVHADETGSKMSGQNKWIHSASTDKCTYLFPHANRGKKAILEAGILQHYRGILTRDCYYSYDTFNHYTSALCCAHFFRELNYIEESTDFKFPKIVKELLLKMKKLVESGKDISKDISLEYYSKYEEVIKDALLEESIANPFHITQVDSLGRKKRSKAFNLLKRLNRVDDVLRFFLEKNADIFTNNAAERDIRNFKVKNKISGGFRSEEGLKYHCRIRGYISTISKNEMNILEGVSQI